MREYYMIINDENENVTFTEFTFEGEKIIPCDITTINTLRIERISLNKINDATRIFRCKFPQYSGVEFKLIHIDDLFEEYPCLVA